MGSRVSARGKTGNRFPQNQLKFCKETADLVYMKIQDLKQKRNAVQMSNTVFPGFVSTLFLGQKKDGDTHPIINLTELNQHLVYEHFKIEGIHLLQDLLIRNNFMVKIDLNDACLTVPIWGNHWKFLRFQLGVESLEFISLPFGVSVAPRISTKLMKTPMRLLRRLGCWLIVYLDDILLMNQSAEGLKKIKIWQFIFW